MGKKEEIKKVEQQIKEFFSSIGKKTPLQIKQMKRLAMHYNIKLGKEKRKFCKKCYSFLQGKKRLKKGKIILTCLKCGNVRRYGYKKKR